MTFMRRVGPGVLCLASMAMIVVVALGDSRGEGSGWEELEQESAELKHLAEREDRNFKETQNEVEDASDKIHIVTLKLEKQESDQHALMERAKILHTQLRNIVNLPNQVEPSEVQKELDGLAVKVKKLIVESRDARHAASLMDAHLFNRVQAAKNQKTRALSALHADQEDIERLPAHTYDKLMRITHPLKTKLRTARDVFADESLKAKILSRNAENIESVASDMSKLLTSVYRVKLQRARRPWQ